MSIQKSAQECLEYLVTKTRDNGDSFVCLKNDRLEWMQTLTRIAHSDQMPNDFRYEFIESALTALANHNDLDDARDSLEADIYTSELTAWLHSRNDRTWYVDEAIREFGKGETLDNDLMMGQLFERYEVFDLIVDYLVSMEEEITA